MEYGVWRLSTAGERLFHKEEGRIMHFEGDYTINAPREKVWAYISDPNSTLSYVPQMKTLSIEGPERFRATVGVGVGSIKGTFDLNFEMVETVAPQHTKMKANGTGIKSHVDLATTIDLAEIPEGKTQMKWTADANVGGLIAGVGQRLLRMVGEKMVNEIFERLKNQLEK
jgi:hypothetical protein